MYQQFELELLQIIGEANVKKAEPMKLHTTFRIGGPADYYVSPEDETELQELLLLCKKRGIPFYVLGNGSNVLFGDYGYRGVVIEIKEKFSYLTWKERIEGGDATVVAGAGILLSKLAKEVANKSLTGFEYAAGIPGTLGGAVTMNAGAYGGEIKDHIVRAKVLSRDGQILDLSREELELGYRRSVIMKEQYIVLEAEFTFSTGDMETITEKIKELSRQRREKQPLEFPSAGSTFKRPEGYFAGKLIQDAGLRGFRIGDIMVSEKHCGFVVNVGNGTASQVKEVVEKVTEKVNSDFGVILEPEVRFVGEFSPM